MFYYNHYTFKKKKLIKTSTAIVACLALSFNAFAQKAELDVTLKRPDNNPATGFVTVTGNDSIRQEELVDGTAYFLLKNETKIKDQKNDFDILVYPNPVKNGFVTIDIRNNNNEHYTVEAYDITGHLIDKAKWPFDNSLRIPAGYESVILRFSNDKEKLFLRRLITLSANTTNINVLTHNKNNTKKSAKTTTSDDYELSYVDSTENLESMTWNITVPMGTRYTIDEILQWSEKTVFWEAITNNQSTITATDLDDYEQLDQVVTANGTIAERGIVKRFNNENGLNIEYSLIAPYTDTATFIIKQYMNEKFTIDSLRNGHFHLTVTGNGENYVVKHNNIQVGSGNVGSESFFKLQKDLAALELIVNGTDLVSDTAYFDMNKGLRTEDMQLAEIPPDQYEHIVDGSALSSLVGKLIKDGAEAYIVKAVGDTAFVNVLDGKFLYSWITENPVETGVKIGLRNIIGHQDAEIVADIDDNEAVDVTAVGDVYGATIPVEVLNKYVEGIQGVTVTGIGTEQTTDAQGKATLVKNGLETDLYNQALASYADSVKFSADHIDDSTINVIYLTNVNPEQSFNIEELFSHMLNLYVASNISGKDIKDGSEAWYSIVPSDTITAGTVDGAASFGFTSKNKTENAGAGVRGIAGHSDIEDAVVIDDNEDLNLEATGDLYKQTVNAHTEDESSNNLQHVLVKSAGKQGLTDVNGDISLVDIILNTNQYNEFTPYTESITAEQTAQSEEFTLQTKNYTAQPGTVGVSFVIPVNKIYNINGEGHLIGADVTGLPNEAIDLLKTGSIRFTTKKDMVNHDIAIDGSGVFNDDIVGPYASGDTLLIAYVGNALSSKNTFSFLNADSVASVGKIRNDDGSYVASLKESGFIQYDAWTTIGKLAGKNLYFVAVSDSVFNNPDAIDMIRGQGNDGITSYVEDTLRFYNDTTQTAGGPLPTAKIQENEDAIDFLINQMTTRTGIPLVNTEKTKGDRSWGDNYGITRKEFYMYRVDIQAGNSVVNWTPNEFTSGLAHARPTEGHNMMVVEGGEGALRALDIYVDGLGWTNGPGFVKDGLGQINDFSWIGDAASKTAYLLPPAFFKKE